MSLKDFTTRIYPFVFIFAVFSLLLLPLRNLTFSPGELESGFYGREQLIHAYANFRLALGDRVFPKAVVGKDGWLFFTAESSVDDYQNTIPLSTDSLTEIRQNFAAVQAELGKRGITLLIVIVPNKSTIYPDYMPVEIPVIGKHSRLDQLLNIKKRVPGLQIMDLRPALRKARQQRQIYYATDTHWNDYGAYVAYQSIIATLGQTFPVLKPHPLTDFQYEPLNEYFDLSVNIGATSLKEEKFRLRPTFDSTTRYKTLALDNGRRINISWNPDSSLPRALIYHDSFFFQVNPMLGAHFSNAMYIPHYTGDEIWNLDWIDEQKPDIVIVEFAERYLHDLPRLLKP